MTSVLKRFRWQEWAPRDHIVLKMPLFLDGAEHPMGCGTKWLAVRQSLTHLELQPVKSEQQMATWLLSGTGS